MKKIVFITPQDATYGFGLTGVTQITTDTDNAEVLLGEVLKNPQTGLTVIDERLLAGIEEEKFREMGKHFGGVLIVLPAPEKMETKEQDYALRLITRAIGYHVRLDV